MHEVLPNLLLGDKRDSLESGPHVDVVVNATDDLPFHGCPTGQVQVRVPVRDNGDDAQQDRLFEALVCATDSDGSTASTASTASAASAGSAGSTGSTGSAASAASAGSAASLIERIADWLRRGRTVLVHCRAGQQRSAAIVAACVMERSGCSAAEAVRFVRSKKPDAFLGAVNFHRTLARLEPLLSTEA
jgi:rhodanese-related sulfurtransferase